MSYEFLQQYWWFLVSLLGAILVFLLFVQGGNSLLFSVGQTDEERRMLVNSTGRKWEFTFTTLVTFGGAFFASFPLFYSTSFGGAYWLWMIILFSFVLQAVSYEFQNKVEKNNLVTGPTPIISSWANASHGLDALLDPWNLVLAFAVFFLARVLGLLYFINNVNDEAIRSRSRRQLVTASAPFVLLFVAFLLRTLLKSGFAADPATGVISMEPMKYLNNLVTMWYVAAALVVGIVLVLVGIFSIAGGISVRAARLVLLTVIGLSFLMSGVRSAQILAQHCNGLAAFLYLCGLELMPATLLVLSAVVL